MIEHSMLTSQKVSEIWITLSGIGCDNAGFAVFNTPENNSFLISVQTLSKVYYE